MLVLMCGAANGACHLALHFGFAMLLMRWFGRVFGVSCGFFFGDVPESNVEVEMLKKQVWRRRNVGYVIHLCDTIVTSPFLSEEILWYYSIAFVLPHTKYCSKITVLLGNVFSHVTILPSLSHLTQSTIPKNTVQFETCAAIMKCFNSC